MVNHITNKEDTEDIRKLISYIDKNGNCKMSYSHIIDGKKQHINIENEKHLTRVFKFIDQSKAGYIVFEGNIVLILKIVGLVLINILFLLQRNLKLLSCFLLRRRKRRHVGSEV
jgi:Ca2+-binding EF-hand superfamily protein